MELFLFARLHGHPGKQAELQRAILEVQGPTRDEPGCLYYGAFCSVRDPDEFFIHSRWRDLASFEQHAKLPHTVRFVAAVHELIDHPFTPTLTRQL